MKSKILSSGIVNENTFYCITEYNNGEYYDLYCLDSIMFPPNLSCNADIERFLMEHDTEGYSISGSFEDVINEYKEMIL